MLYGRAGCHLCDEARAVVARVCGDVGVPWVEVDVDADLDDRSLADEGVARTGASGTSPAAAGLAAAYGDRVPVVVVGGIDVAQYRVSERALRAALA